MALSAGERERLRRLFDDYHRDRDPALRDELVAAHLRLAMHLARRFTNRGVPLDDLIQVASMGLFNAVERFDPDRGLEFSSYATPTIVGELKRHFRDKGWAVRVPRRVQELHIRLNLLVGELTQRYGRSPTIEELARAARASEEEVLEAMEASRAYRSSSLDQGLVEPAGAETDTPEQGTDADILFRVDDRMMVERLLEALEPREQLMVRLRFFDEMTQGEIGQRLGISQMHVSRLLRRSLDQLRAVLDAQSDGSTAG